MRGSLPSIWIIGSGRRKRSDLACKSVGERELVGGWVRDLGEDLVW